MNEPTPTPTKDREAKATAPPGRRRSGSVPVPSVCAYARLCDPQGLSSTSRQGGKVGPFQWGAVASTLSAQ